MTCQEQRGVNHIKTSSIHTTLHRASLSDFQSQISSSQFLVLYFRYEDKIFIAFARIWEVLCWIRSLKLELFHAWYWTKSRFNSRRSDPRQVKSNRLMTRHVSAMRDIYENLAVYLSAWWILYGPQVFKWLYGPPLKIDSFLKYFHFKQARVKSVFAVCFTIRRIFNQLPLELFPYEGSFRPWDKHTLSLLKHINKMCWCIYIFHSS